MNVTIQLGSSTRRMSGKSEWWSDYLAWLASGSGALMEQVVEENLKDGFWWVAICLDGAPERVRARQKHGPARIYEAEERFQFMIRKACVPFKRTVPKAEVQRDFRDGVIFGYEYLDDAKGIVRGVHTRCAQVNRDESLGWEWQFHMRAGIGQSIRDMFSALLTAQSNECFIRRPEEKLPSYLVL